MSGERAARVRTALSFCNQKAFEWSASDQSRDRQGATESKWSVRVNDVAP